MLLSPSLLLLATALPADACTLTVPEHGSARAESAPADVKNIVETAVAAGSFKTLASALQAGGLIETLQGKGPFTVFAPTDAAFAALPAGTLASLLEPKNVTTLQAILTYHVVPGALAAVDVAQLGRLTTVNGQRVEVVTSDSGVQVDGAKVSATDIRCSNGVIHVIDAVILPSSKDLVTTAVDAGKFATLAAALKAAGLVEALKGAGPFTVFAPTDQAFAALPAGTLESLLRPENKERLVAILELHVVSGRVFSDAAAKGATVATLQGSSLTTSSRNGDVFVNGARVLSADVDASNGVIHVIDRVLLPE